MARIVDHLSVAALEARYRAARDVTEARHLFAGIAGLAGVGYADLGASPRPRESPPCHSRPMLTAGTTFLASSTG